MTTQQASPIQIVIQTELGNIEASIDTMRTPTTSTNFLKYVDEGFYDGGRFHRTVWIDNQPQNDIKIEVIQAGINPDHDAHKFAPIRMERTHESGLRHRDGTLSMARFAPDSAQSDFFICIGDQPSLDYGGLRNPDGQGFAAFGQVTAGMDVVRKIQKSPCEAQTLTPPIQIVAIRRQA